MGKAGVFGHHGGDGHRHHVRVMGGVMKLGKALATGIAQERPEVHEEELRIPEEVQEPALAAPEEVPAAR
ncbi:Hypothetical Protein sle_52280 [Streptomyces leeuwenhoekii]|jgi:hypothetical protein|uniref:Uncharacterized protein n=1 Tax=Streptomyces leeuwenhoekii TaxID=1437453 RepID=A0A0F7W655_STRLW|nr:hypothetical protein ACH49_09945 [Streptomyces leeuwenhoekii]CQR64686.1 Hypothetical Protein sle_52280 [Streptomyces leeuwenhoekii]